MADETIDRTKSPVFLGRYKILIDDVEINESNVVDILHKCLQIHNSNAWEEDYLYNYRKGLQPILSREKTVRPEINNRLVENHSSEITSFKVSYLLNAPVSYTASQTAVDINDDLIRLNKWMKYEKKKTKDFDLETWAHTCGVGVRMVLPDAMADLEQDECPFELYSLDPRRAFVAYGNSLGEPRRMGVKYIIKEDGSTIYSVYTATDYYEICFENYGTPIMLHEINPLGKIPLVEYTINQERMGCFEKVLPLLDAINLTSSDRVNGIQQFIQSLLLFHNVKLDEEATKDLKDLGGIQFDDNENMPASISYLNAELNQTETQVLVTWMYQVVLYICGMPNRNGGSSTSDTGAATIVRDGWYDAEGKAQEAEERFDDAEMDFLDVALYISNVMSGTKLNPMDIDIKLPRKNYENIQQKAQVLTTLLANDKIAPRRAYIASGMFTDSEEAYAEGMEYYKKVKEEAQKEALAVAKTQKADPSKDGSEDPEKKPEDTSA